MLYENLEHLFKRIFGKSRTLVYGDLGRLPHIVVDHLCTHHSNLKILFVSMYYAIPIPNHVHFRQIHYKDASSTQCDLLVIVEPSAHAFVRTRQFEATAARVVVLTSHAVLELDDPEIETAIYFHGTVESFDRAVRIRRTMDKQEGSEEAEDVRDVVQRVGHPSVVTIGPGSGCDVVLNPGKSAPLRERDCFVVVDLTTSSLTTNTFLFFWDAVDYLVANFDRVERWSVCFGHHGKTLFDNFVQECIDRLHCSKFFQNHHLKYVLPMLPFYRSGTLNFGFDGDTSKYVRHEYVAPDTLEAAFRAAIAHDLQQLVGGVMSIVK